MTRRSILINHMLRTRFVDSYRSRT